MGRGCPRPLSGVLQTPLQPAALLRVVELPGVGRLGPPGAVTPRIALTWGLGPPSDCLVTSVSNSCGLLWACTLAGLGLLPALCSGLGRPVSTPQGHLTCRSFALLPLGARGHSGLLALDWGPGSPEGAGVHGPSGCCPAAGRPCGSLDADGHFLSPGGSLYSDWVSVSCPPSRKKPPPAPRLERWPQGCQVPRKLLPCHDPNSASPCRQPSGIAPEPP